MPADGVTWLPKEQLLTCDQIRDVASAAVAMHGIGRFKLTGGEPTVRSDLLEIVARLRNVPGVEDLSLTTNGLLLERLAQPLRDAGLDRVTVSIDSLRPDRFRRITRTGNLDAVIRGLDEAERAGFSSVKVNCVTMRGINDDEVIDFARLTLTRRLTVRFIEYMPLGDAAVLHDDAITEVDPSEVGPTGGCGAQDRGTDVFVSEAQVRDRIEQELGPLEAVDRESEAGVGPANVYQLRDGNPVGRIGFISAMSQPFCSTCNRLRLTATGVLRSCLFEGGEVDIRPILLQNLGDDERREAIAHAMTDCVRLKPQVHSGRGHEPMSRMGG